MTLIVEAFEKTLQCGQKFLKDLKGVFFTLSQCEFSLECFLMLVGMV